MKLSLSMDSYVENMRERGWAIMERAIDDTLVDRMLEDLDRSWETCREVMIRNGVFADAELTVHHLIGQGPSFLSFIDEMEPLMPFLEHYFEGRFILNSFGGAINSFGRTSYAQRVHRDIRSFSGDMPSRLGWAGRSGQRKASSAFSRNTLACQSAGSLSAIVAACSQSELG